jgi:uncharacterized membrane protein
MSLWQKRAVLSAVIWGLVAGGFVVCFFAGDGPSGFIEGNARRNIGGGFLAVGIGAHLIISFFTRRLRKGGSVVVDERDEMIRRKASEAAFNVLAVFVFLVCIALHDAFDNEGGVPAGWLWFLAYSSFILAYLCQAVGAVIFYYWAGSSEQGGQG